MSSASVDRALALHLARSGSARQLSTVCDDAIKRRGAEPLFLLLRALAAAREGNTAAASRDLDGLKTRRDSDYAAAVVAASISARGTSSAGSSSVAGAERASVSALYLAAAFLHATGADSAAAQAIERADREAGGPDGGHALAPSILALRVWVAATAGTRPGARAIACDGASLGLHSGAHGPSRSDSDALAAPTKALSDALAAVPVSLRDADASLALAAALERAGDYSRAHDVLAETVAGVPEFWPAVAARGRLAVRRGDWEGAWDAAVALLEGDADNIEGHRLATLCVLVREGPGARAAERTEELVAATQRAEPRSPRLWVEISRSATRLAGRSRGVLAPCIRLIEAATRIEPTAASLPVELGTQRLLAGDASGALAAFREASRLDEANADAVAGAISAQLALGDVEDAAAQLDMFRIIAESLGKPPEVALLEAVVAARSTPPDRGAALEALAEAVSLHSDAFEEAIGFAPPVPGAKPHVKGTPAPLPPLAPATLDVFDFYALLAPEFLLDVAKEYLVARGDDDATPSGSSAATVTDGSTHPRALALSTRIAPDALDLSSPAATAGLLTLDRLTFVIPAAMPAWLLSAHVFAAAGEWGGAARAIGRVLASDPAYTEAHLLSAKVALLRGGVAHARAASASLEAALAHNFGVQEWPVFQLLRVRATFAAGRLEEALALSESLLRGGGGGAGAAAGAGATVSGGVAAGADASRRRPALGASSAPTASGAKSNLPVADRIAATLLVVDILTALGRASSAVRALDDLSTSFTGGREPDRIIISRASLQLTLNDFDGALALLDKVTPSSTSSSEALALRATIFLKHRRDEARYIACFSGAVAASAPGTAARVAALTELGRAHMRVGEPEDAVTAFQSAQAERRALCGGASAADAELARAIGSALVASHDYRRAVSYFSGALANSSNTASATAALRADFADLLTRLGRFDDAAAHVDSALAEADADSANGMPRDVAALKLVIGNLRTLARVRSASRDSVAAVAALERALTLQRRVLDATRASVASADAEDSWDAPVLTAAAGNSVSGGATLDLDSEKEATAALCLELSGALPAEDAARRRTLCDEAVQLTPDSDAVHIASARSALARGDNAGCRENLHVVTSRNPTSVDATVMLANLHFRGSDLPAAISALNTLLDASPRNYAVMHRLALLLKRAGRAKSDIPRLLRAAARDTPSAERDAGYRFVNGLLLRFSNEPSKAARVFNSVRTSSGLSSRSSGGSASANADNDQSDWAALATEQMVWIYLSPDGDPLWTVKNGPDGAPASSTTPELLATTTQLLESASASTRSTVKWEILQCHVLIASRALDKVDEAVARLAAVLETDPESIPALHALAVAFMVTDAQSKARNQLKRLLKLPTAGAGEWAEESFGAWLMLADLYDLAGKPDQAGEAVQRAIALDGSAGRAWEYLGTLAEKELRYSDAADAYENAWRCEGGLSAPIGYKLAFNYVR